MYPQARAAIKYLVADGRYDYIETGSLISIKENVKDIVIPSEERHLNMYPLDFEEFAWALGEDVLLDCIRNCFNKKIPMDRGLHNKAMLLFKQYMLVGGMPKPVILFSKFMTSRSVRFRIQTFQLRTIQKDLIGVQKISVIPGRRVSVKHIG